MNWLWSLAGCLIAITLIAAAFLYPFNPKRIQNVLKELILAVLALIFLGTLAFVFSRAVHPLLWSGVIPLVAVVAYVLREHRLRRQPVRRTGQVERTPVLPREEDES